MTSNHEDDGGRDGPPWLEQEHPPHASRIIFGSCNSQHYEQPFWKVIRERNPTAFVWTGDAVYADDRRKQSDLGEEPSTETSAETPSTSDNAPWWWPSLSRFRSRSLGYTGATPEYLRELYQQQLKVPGYRDLITDENGGRGNISIFGALDDHDYGINNGDKTFPFRKESGIEFTKFLGLNDESSAMSRRASKGLGVYGVQVYDFSSMTVRLLSDSDAGLDPDVVPDAIYIDRLMNKNSDENNHSSSDQLVAIFVLDVRSNKTPWAKSYPELYALDPEGDFLGEDQWKWFETAIGRSKARVNIIVSGIQVHAPWFYDVNKIENWSGFPKAQHRLYQTILQPNVRAPILFSGDVHMAQFLRKDCRRMVPTTETGKEGDSENTSHRMIRPLYEVTSSGMTHSWGSKASYCGRPKNSKLCTFYPFNVLVEIVMTYAHFASPWTALLRGNDDDRSIDSRRSRKRRMNMQRQYTLDRNIAEVELDWAENLVAVRILGDKGETLLRQDWSMDRLTGGSGTTTETETFLNDKSFDVGQERLEASLRRTFSRDHDDYVCVNYRGNIDAVHFVFGIVSSIGLFMTLGLFPILFCFGVLSKFIIRRCRQGKKTLREGREESKCTSSVVERPKND